MIKRSSLIVYALLAIIACWTVSCGSGSQSQHPDVSAITLSYTSHPFYKDFADLDTSDLEAGITGLARKYPYFLDFYLTNLTNIKDPQNEARSRQNLLISSPIRITVACLIR